MSQQLKYKIRHGHNLHLYKVRVLEEHKEETYRVVSDGLRYVTDYFERIKGRIISGIDLERTEINVLIPDCKFD